MLLPHDPSSLGFAWQTIGQPPMCLFCLAFSPVADPSPCLGCRCAAATVVTRAPSRPHFCAAYTSLTWRRGTCDPYCQTLLLRVQTLTASRPLRNAQRLQRQQLPLPSNNSSNNSSRSNTCSSRGSRAAGRMVHVVQVSAVCISGKSCSRCKADAHLTCIHQSDSWNLIPEPTCSVFTCSRDKPL